MAQPVAAWANSIWQRALEWPHPAEPPVIGETVAPSQAPAPVPPPAIAARMHMKNQSTGTDARSERMVRQVREEVQELRSALDATVNARDELLQVDTAAVCADPETAAALPGASLVRAILAEVDAHKQTKAVVARRDKRIKALNAQARQLRQENAFLQGRLQTFEDTLRALYSNLEDLRQLRDTKLETNLRLHTVAEEGEMPSPPISEVIPARVRRPRAPFDPAQARVADG